MLVRVRRALGPIALSALAMTAVLVAGQRPGASPPAVRRAIPSNDFPVCLGTDGVLRAATGACRPSERRISLDRAEGQTYKCKDCDGFGKPLAVTPDRGRGAIADMARRLDTLDRSPLLTVVDRSNRVILAVSTLGVSLYDKAGAPVVVVSATSDGGLLTARSSDLERSVSVGVSGTRSGLAVSDGGVPRVDVGRQDAGNYALRVMASGSVVAGVGESRAGSGTAVIGDSEGRVRGVFSAADSAGAIELSGQNATIVSMRQSQLGAGLLSLGEAGGQEAVKMDVNDNRYGAVLAGPRLGAPLFTGSGLPGSYILGCAGGDACRPR